MLTLAILIYIVFLSLNKGFKTMPVTDLSFIQQMMIRYGMTTY